MSSYKRMPYHSISTLIIFCHFLINSVTKPFSTKMTENNQSFFPFFPNILTQKKSKNPINFVTFVNLVKMTGLIGSPCGLAEMTENNQS